MVSDVSNDKELFRYIGRLSNEVIQIQKTLQTIGSHEARVRAALDELVLEKEILIEQTDRLETIVKQTATSAVVDAELERERQETMESEKISLQTQIMEMEESLRSKAARVTELEEQFTAKIEDLNGQIREKDSLLEVRDIAMKDLKAAADSLNRLVSGLSSNAGSRALLPDEPQDDPRGETMDAITEIEAHTSMEIENLQVDIHEKEWALAAKSLESEIAKTMGGTLDEAETSLGAKKKRKPLRLASLLSDMGGKRFL
ncbi:MAG: hypothetical protein ACREQ2_19185 [Candidatus Binatia bacterium]